jgi:hypothetical protein
MSSMPMCIAVPTDAIHALLQMPEALDDKQKATVRTLFARAKWLPL